MGELAEQAVFDGRQNMSAPETWPWPANYGVLRVLSEGEGGVVALARRASGDLTVLKLLRLSADARPEEALARHERLRLLTTAPGLLRITACGLTADRDWLWEELEPADGLEGGPPSTGDDYQPATLRAELIERGPLSTEAALSVGLAVCGGLETLHTHGLVHRDVKPGNLLRVSGKVVLGYGEFQVRNWRWEFDVNTGSWIEVEKNDPQREPRCRTTRAFMPLDGGRKLLLFGGYGNSSGKQGERDPGFKIWGQQFHSFGDVWLLDLATGKWDCILPAPGLELPNDYACAYIAQHNALVVVHAHDNATPQGTPPDVYVLRLEKGAICLKAGSQGDVPDVRTPQFLTALPGGRSLAAFMMPGIFDLTLEV